MQFKPTPNFVGRTSVYYSSVTDKIDKASGLQPEKPLLGTDYYDNTKGLKSMVVDAHSDGDLHFLIEGSTPILWLRIEIRTHAVWISTTYGTCHSRMQQNGFSLRLRGDFYSKGTS